MGVDSWIQGSKVFCTLGVNIIVVEFRFGKGRTGQLHRTNGFSNFPNTRVHHIDNTTSNHKMLWIERLDLEFQQKKKVFLFKEMWLADKGCGEIVEGIWQVNYDVTKNKRVLKKIETCGKELTRWSRDCLGNIRKRKKKKKTILGREASCTRWRFNNSLTVE